LDLAPTILAACGIQPSQELPGRNLLDEKQADTARDTLFGEIYEHDVADIDKPRASLLFRWCVTDEWKLILPITSGGPELYRIRTDPWEKQNVADKHPDAVAELTKRIDGWWAAD
jgi:arylsulfatase A-like enzyme